MKLKKALRLYPIEASKMGSYFIGKKRIEDTPIGWMEIFDNRTYIGGFTEKQAVAWLIEGAERKPIVNDEAIFIIEFCPHCGKKL